MIVVNIGSINPGIYASDTCASPINSNLYTGNTRIRSINPGIHAGGICATPHYRALARQVIAE